MNYQNIDKEIKKYTEFFKVSQSTLSKLSNYYKEIGKAGGKFADKMKKLLDEFYIDLMKEDRSNTFNKLLINFYNEKNSFINRIRAYFLLIEKNYGERLSDFEKDHQNKIKEALLKLSRMNTTLIECKTSVSEKASFSIKKNWLTKNKEESYVMNKSYNALCFDFGDNGNRYYVIDEKLFIKMKEALENYGTSISN
jgi:hypothetical protein